MLHWKIQHTEPDVHGCSILVMYTDAEKGSTRSFKVTPAGAIQLAINLKDAGTAAIHNRYDEENFDLPEGHGGILGFSEN